MPKNHDATWNAKNLILKGLAGKTEKQIKDVQNLSSQLHRDLEKSYKARESVLSITSGEFGE